MVGGRITRLAAKLLSPFLYVAGFSLVGVGAWKVALFLWGIFEYTEHYVFGVSIAMIFPIGVIVFGALELVLRRLEELQRPTLWDHLRHCALLYLVLVPSTYLSATYLMTYLTDGAGIAPGAWIFVLLAFLAASLGLLIDMLALIRQRRRFDHAGEGM